jgi:hypothetical protein
MDEQELNRRANALVQQGRERIGTDNFEVMSQSINRYPGMTSQHLANTLQQDDALEQVLHFGREAVLSELSRLNDPFAERRDNARVKVLEDCYASIRDKERSGRRKR